MRKIEVPLILTIALLFSKMAAEMLRVKKLTEFAILPSRGSKYAAGIHACKLFETEVTIIYGILIVGFDLSSAYDIVIPSRGKAIVKTDIAIAIPPNTYARIGNLQ